MKSIGRRVYTWGGLFIIGYGLGRFMIEGVIRPDVYGGINPKL